MNTYALLFILPAIPCLLSRFPRLTNTDRCAFKKAAMILFFFVLFFLTAFRAHSVGNDTKNYMNIYHRFASRDFAYALTYKEPAFAVLCKLVDAVFGDYQWLLIIVAALSIVPVMLLYSENAEYPMTTIALFVFLSVFYMYFSGLRQTIAIGIGMIAYYFTKKKKLVFFILAVFMAYLFHRSAIVLIIMYPVYRLRLMKRDIVFIVLGMVAIYVFNRPIFALLNGLIQDYEGLGDSNTGAFMMLVLLIVFSVFAFVISEEDSLDPDTIGLRNFLLLTTAIQMFVPLNFLVMRMGYYYMIFLPITMTRFISRASRWSQVAMIANLVLFLFFAVHFFVFAPSTNTLHIFPYHFFWEMV